MSYLFFIQECSEFARAVIKKRRVKRIFILEWFNSEIQAAIAARSNLHKKAILENSPSNWKDYRSARSRVDHLIRNAKP